VAIESAREKYDVSVEWRPFFLRPSMPKEGVAKGPGRRVSPRLKAAGASVGIDFTGNCDRYPNSLIAHCALDYALELEKQGKAEAGTQHALQEKLFHGYFTAGLYPNIDNIVAMAENVGIDPSSMRRELEARESSGRAVRVEKEAYQASRSGISGVPYFIINDEPAFSGAQHPSTIADAFEEFAN